MITSRTAHRTERGLSYNCRSRSIAPFACVRFSGSWSSMTQLPIKRHFLSLPQIYVPPRSSRHRLARLLACSAGHRLADLGSSPPPKGILRHTSGSGLNNNICSLPPPGGSHSLCSTSKPSQATWAAIPAGNVL